MLEKDYQKLFNHLEGLDAPADLFDKIVSRIQDHQRRQARQKFWTFSVSGFVSLIALIPTIKVFVGSLVKSGFWQFLSLLFSDFKLVLSNGDSFLLSLVETLPILNLILCLAFIIVFLWSLRLIGKNAKSAFQYSSNI